jgi:dTDP-4-dehydrorhamnose 3,5-epimerase
MKCKLIRGDKAVDDRGGVSFVNEFHFASIQRFYQVQNHQKNFVRAWHGHKKEEKFVYVASGVALVAAVKIDSWENPSPDLALEKFILSSEKPGILHIPAGYANGFMTLSEATVLMFFSSAKLEESLNDDFRFPSRFWNPWTIEER